MQGCDKNTAHIFALCNDTLERSARSRVSAVHYDLFVGVQTPKQTIKVC